MIKTSQKRLSGNLPGLDDPSPKTKLQPQTNQTQNQPQASVQRFSANPKIKEMQTKIQEFAQKLLSYASQQPIVGKPADAKLDKGKEAILDWIDENFLSAVNLSNDAEAREFTAKEDDMESYMDKLKRSTDFIQSRNLAQTLNQIGSPKSKESVAEGVWGPRTQNAIKIVAMFGDALSKAIDALEGSSEVSFDKRSVEYIKKIHEIFDSNAKDKLTDAQKSKYADYIILCVKSLSKSFDSFIRYADKSGLKSYISSGVDGNGPRQPLFQITDKGPTSQIGSEIEKYKSQILKSNFSPIALPMGLVLQPKVLLDPISFKTEVQKQAIQKGLISLESTSEEIKKVLEQALNELTQVSSVPAQMGLK